ncbi:hypothetical protein N8J89_14190 [Crossiella sp. CA-258035]|uniref:hypothetical protein n=1 Tax=Crossiella sp. CA-258035 TaxID=2981138 RepID=UPI0024BD15FF|nr:hypothetical protein [Crossiella sp. CA-258035]WHT22166.1 hypothetical protein N8J89_14190 [Crossiella sp. CA-258035]
MRALLRLAYSVVAVVSGTILGTAGLAVAADNPPPMEEDYAYPGADKIFAERGIRLLKGNGVILLTTCVPGHANQIVLSSSAFTDPICFAAGPGAGFVSMDIPEVYSVKGDSHRGSVTVRVKDVTSTSPITPNRWNPVNNGDGGTLLELRTQP